MGWETSMFAVFDDLEQQAEGLHLADRDAEVADRTAAEYATISLAARLHASLGRDLRLRLLGGRAVAGRLARVGADWLLLTEHSGEWVVRHAGIATVSGLSPRADAEQTWSVSDRLGLRTVLRRLAAAAEPCLVRLCDDQQVEGRIGRVGRDFVEVQTGEGPDRAMQHVPLASVVALQGRSR